MKKFLVACSGALLLAAACGQSGPGGGTGSAGSSGGGSPGAGGNDTGSGGNGNGGTTGVGGGAGTDNPGNGGTSPDGVGGANPQGVAGSTGAGGTAGSAGATGVGGTTGNGGTAGSTAGNSGLSGNGGTAGGAAGRGGAGGSAGGAGGRGGAGGSAGGAAGRGGAGGTGGTGGSTCPTIATLAPSLDGYYWEVSPSGNTALSGTNYPFGSPGGGCPTGATWDTTGYIKTYTPITVGGTTGQKYTIAINVRGVVGTRCYMNGTPGSTAAGSGTGQNNTWYAGGVQAGDSIWNTMEIRVSPKVNGTANGQSNANYDIYYTNSFQSTNNFCQKEATYETRFDASFPVLGGGTITMVVHDSNCRTLQNCGAVENQASCDTSASRSISMSGVNPAPPASFAQPVRGQLNGTTYSLQWVWIDVTGVTCN